MPLTASEQLSYSTVRIECEYVDGSSGTGTGFFFNFLEDKEKQIRTPVIVTNKHVIEGSTKGKFVLTKADENGHPIDQDHSHFEWNNFESFWRKHPDPTVDLCAIPIVEIYNFLKGKGSKFFHIALNKELIPSEKVIEELSALEEILMVGYPNGIWDNINNKPIFRRGITASHPKFDYCGKKEIMIDAACFPGSSGSPVFIFNEGVFKHRTGGLIGGDRVILLGVLYAGPQFDATGEIHIVDVPTLQKPISISSIPNNLGLVIKAERILELEELFK